MAMAFIAGRFPADERSTVVARPGRSAEHGPGPRPPGGSSPSSTCSCPRTSAMPRRHGPASPTPGRTWPEVSTASRSTCPRSSRPATHGESHPAQHPGEGPDLAAARPARRQRLGEAGRGRTRSGSTRAIGSCRTIRPLPDDRGGGPDLRRLVARRAGLRLIFKPAGEPRGRARAGPVHAGARQLCAHRRGAAEHAAAGPVQAVRGRPLRPAARRPGPRARAGILVRSEPRAAATPPSQLAPAPAGVPLWAFRQVRALRDTSSAS